jgi:hypothetical protein
MHREMTQGIEKHRAARRAFDGRAQFHEMATKSGTDLKTALTRYTNMETLLRQNPLRASRRSATTSAFRCATSRRSCSAAARSAAVAIRRHDPRAQADARALEQQVGGVTNHFQQQAESSLQEHITEWADKPPHFEIIAPHIAAEMRDGCYRSR